MTFSPQDTVIDSIEEIAAQLGASVDASRGSVSIGMSGDSYHVDTTGQGRLKKSRGGKDFNQDAQAAVAYAIQDLIKDGVLVGLRQGTERLLKDAVDLSAGLSKALKFEGVFRDLKRLKDPVAAAIDDLKTEFDSLRNVFKDAGASTEEYAQLEEDDQAITFSAQPIERRCGQSRSPTRRRGQSRSTLLVPEVKDRKTGTVTELDRNDRGVHAA